MNLFRYRPAKRAGRFLTFVAAGSLFLSVASVSAYAQTAPPNISGLSTTVVQSGSTLTIYGSNFDWSVAAPDVNDSVMLGSVELPVESWSTTSITVMVPIDAASGQLTVNADNGTSNAVTLAVAARGILELNQTGQVAGLDGAGLFEGPAPGKSYAVAIQSTPDGSGYWILDKNGTVDSYGDATKMAPSAKAPTPAVGLAINPSGTAGWVLSQDGIVTNLAETNQTVAQTVYSLPVGTYVAMAADPLHSGYYALNKGGTVIGEGSVAGTWHSSVSDPVALAADPNGGFWVLGQNGSVDAVDGAQSFGGLQTTIDLTKQTAVAIASTPDGNGYYIATNTGKIYAFGDAVLPTDIPASQTSTPTTALAIVGPYQHYSVEDLAYWYPPGNLSQYVSFQNSMGQADNIISPHWYGVNANGTVSGPGSSIVTQVAEMQANGLQVVPMFGRTFNSTLGPLATVSGQDQLVSNIMAEVNQYHLNGANIDFEALPDNSEGYLDAFVQKLRAALGPSRLLVTNVYPDWTSYTNQEGQTVPGYSDSVYNYTELSQLSNYMVVMAYSLSFNPGPIASLTHDTGVIDYLLHGPSGTGSSGVDLNHVLLGIPGYGQVWEGTTGYGMGNSMTVPQITSMLAKLHVTPTFDPHAGEDFAHYRIPFTAPQATIANGDTGTDVVALQYGLSQVLAHPKAFGADNTNGTPPALPLAFDGIFGNDTEAAVSAFQTDFDISGDPSGVYGPATRAKLASLASQYASKFSPGVPATVWFDNAEADLVHAQLAQSSGLAGVSLWAMGEADPAYFSTLASGTDVTANPDLAVTLSAPTLYAGTTNQETVTVAQGTGFPIANLTVTLLGHTATTNGSGQASFTVDPASVGSDSIAVTDPSGQAVANTTVSVAAPTIARLAGATRYQTAIQLANSALSEAHTVILTTATNYPDALSGAPLAKALGAPILLTDPTTLTAATAKELANLGAKNVVLLGGPAAIAPAVSTTLQQEGYTVTRYAGASRFGTAAEIAMALGDPSRIAVIANGDSFQNALAVAPIAASQGWPLLLANGQNQTAPLTHSSIEALEKLGVTSVYIIGDTTEIPASISGQLTQLHIQSVRIQGQASAGPVYGTNLAVLEYFASKISLSHLYLATGTDFPDALTAAPVAAESDSAVLLIPGTGPLESQETAWLSSQTGHVGVADIVGGVDAITPTNADQVASDLGIKPT
jgi:putative cell wall-binding protein/spore germination protein YaaH